MKKYSEKDYEGEFNLKSAEKALIQKAQERFKGNSKKMAKALEVRVEILLLKIEMHNL
jgi:transcriptional regulator with PAS, ATPase and Fis domain